MNFYNIYMNFYYYNFYNIYMNFFITLNIYIHVFYRTNKFYRKIAECKTFCNICTRYLILLNNISAAPTDDIAKDILIKKSEHPKI